MTRLHSFKPVLIDAYRYVTAPWRALSWHHARRQGTLPVGILYYHRVADIDSNPWTISCDDFRRQIEWLQSRFEIVSLDVARQRILGGHNRVPTLSLTFDDGYADNATFALPLLIKRKIPFTYFVTTSHTVAGKPFDHDLERGQPLAPNSIEGLKAMADAGVEIGGHTRNHANLGEITDPEQLFDEVVVATRELQQQIGHPIRYFAFPFGQIENLNAEVFRLAKEHGFAAVCSAYGGWNEIGGEAFHLQRIHGDPELSRLKNWLTFDPRKRKVWQADVARQLLAQATAQQEGNHRE